jgi:hypothetical protein
MPNDPRTDENLLDPLSNHQASPPLKPPVGSPQQTGLRSDKDGQDNSKAGNHLCEREAAHIVVAATPPKRWTTYNGLGYKRWSARPMPRQSAT